MFLTVVIIVTAVFAYQIFNSNTKVAEAGWYSSGGTWGYRKPITIDRNKVNTATGTTTPLSNFPVLISVTDSDLMYTGSGGKVGKTDGTDILFTSADGTTKLNHEIESYSSTTGASIFWVQVTSLAKTSDTVLYIYFGNSGASDQQNKPGVWDSNYKAVYHLPNGSTLTALDSTAKNNGTLSGSPAAISGKIDGAADFSGSNHIIASSSPIVAGQTAWTVSGWIKTTATNVANGRPIYVERASSGQNILKLDSLDLTRTTQALVTYRDDGGSLTQVAGTTAINNGAYHYIVGKLTAGNIYIYIDGVLENSATRNGTDTLTNSGIQSWIAQDNGDGAANFVGSIDEVRVSNTGRSPDWIATEFNNLTSPGSFYAYGSLGIQNRAPEIASEGYNNRGVPALSWYNSSWTNRKQITIDRTKVSGVSSSTLNSFPLLFNVIDSDLKHTGSGGKVGKTDGTDILFTAADGTTKLDHEIESYNSSTGATIAWVRIPILSAITDTTIYIYFGNSGASDQQNKTAVWDSGFQGVWHLPDGTTLGLTDSTAYGYNGTNFGATAVAGKIGGASAFAGPGPDQYINVGTITGLSGVTTATLSGWVYRSNTGHAVQFGQSMTDYHFNLVWFTDGSVYIQPENGGASFPSFTPPDSTGWHYVVFIFDGSQTGLARVRGYWDGVLQTVVQGFSPLPPASLASGGNQSNFLIGAGIGNPYTTGNIDEVRVSNNIRSEDWIKTEYNNQFFSSTFYAYGAISANGRQTSSGTEAPAIKIRGGVRFK